MKHAFAYTALCVCALLCGCSKELTRSKAKDIIQGTYEFSPDKQWIEVSANEVNVLVNRGYLAWRDAQLTVLSAGKPFFDDARGRLLLSGIAVPFPFAVLLANPIGREVIDVSRISGEGDVKTVEFTWRWNRDSQPKEVKETIFETVAVRKDAATLKRYDDGWRFANWEHR